MITGLDAVYAALADCDPSLRRGMVYCLTCGKSQKVNAAECFKHWMADALRPDHESSIAGGQPCAPTLSS